MDDHTRETLLSSAFHDVGPVISGCKLRPLSLATFDVLLRTGNPLIGGTTPPEGTPEYNEAVFGYTYAHAGRWPEIARASFNPQEFREKALIFCGRFTPEDYRTVGKAIEDQGRQLGAAQVTSAATGGKKKWLPSSLDSLLRWCSRWLAKLVGRKIG